MGAVLYVLYPSARTLYANTTGIFANQQYYPYALERPITVPGDIGAPPAEAVPILMYHGIVDHLDIENTTQENFIAQMEMLKHEGYETISFKEMDDAFHGRGVLPPKPIIISFDDGRRDSYYPTDEIFRTLGFQASIFLATIKANTNDPFYLNWDEVKKLWDSGRWDVEAHGRNSHDRVKNGFFGQDGRYLTSRIYTPFKGLEPVDEFKQRVEQDYVNGINDIRAHLGFIPKYYAIPLNDYGAKMSSNYLPSFAFNETMTKKYFSYAFVEVNGIVGPDDVETSFYNFSDDDPLHLNRLEVKNTPAATLKKLLDEWAPAAPNMQLSGENLQQFKDATRLAYGNIAFTNGGLHLLPSLKNESVKVLFGDKHWNNYSVTARFAPPNGRSTAVLANHTDNNDYISFGITDHNVFFRETYKGTETELIPSVRMDVPFGDNDLLLTLIIRDGSVAGYCNGIQIFVNVPIKNTRGEAGVKAWNNTSSGHVLVKSFEVRSNSNPRR